MSNGNAPGGVQSAGILTLTTLQRLLVGIPWMLNPPASISPANTALTRIFQSHSIAKRRHRRRTFPFFYLPLELRELIYDWAFFDSKFIIRHVNMRVKVLYDIHRLRPCEQTWPPSWTLVSKQFFSEAVAQMHFNACFVFDIEAPLSGHPRPVGTLRVDHARSVTLIDSAQRCVRPRSQQPGNAATTWSIHAGGNKLKALRQAAIHLEQSTVLHELNMHFRFDFPNAAGVAVRASDMFPWREQFDTVPFQSLFSRLPRNIQHVVVSSTNYGLVGVPAGERAFEAFCFCLATTLRECTGQEQTPPWNQLLYSGRLIWRFKIEATSALFRRRRTFRF
jgi:hypothetical protein